MKLHFLGTGAADWKLADKEREDYRFFSSALIDGVLLIDSGPDVFVSAKKYGIDLSGIKYVIRTHSHSDHFCEETLNKLVDNGAQFIEFCENEQKCFGEYKVTSYKANHGTCEDAVHFIIEKNGKRIFYGLDSCWLMYDEVCAIKENGVDIAVIDATIGNVKGDYRVFEHNNLEMVRIMKDSLKDNIKKFIISHMAYTLHDEHSVLAEQMSKENIITAFDNFMIEI